MSSDKIKLPLTKPIEAHGDTVSQLEFRAPTGEDILEIGSPPFSVDDKKRTYFDLAVTGEYVVRLAGIPLSSVKQMSPADLMGAFGVVAGFFGALEMIPTNSSKDTIS